MIDGRMQSGPVIQHWIDLLDSCKDRGNDGTCSLYNPDSKLFSGENSYYLRDVL